jgi:hypothetical protein
MDDCRRLGSLRWWLALTAMLLLEGAWRRRDWQGWERLGLAGCCCYCCCCGCGVVRRSKGAEEGKGEEEWQKGCDCSVVEGRCWLRAVRAVRGDRQRRQGCGERKGRCNWDTSSQKGAQGGRAGRSAGQRVGRRVALVRPRGRHLVGPWVASVRAAVSGREVRPAGEDCEVARLVTGS